MRIVFSTVKYYAIVPDMMSSIGSSVSYMLGTVDLNGANDCHSVARHNGSGE